MPDLSKMKINFLSPEPVYIYFLIAAYAEVQRLQNGVVVQSEIDWGEGDRFHPSDWGTSFDVCQSDCSSN
jgi:hypothetical protein